MRRLAAYRPDFGVGQRRRARRGRRAVPPPPRIPLWFRPARRAVALAAVAAGVIGACLFLWQGSYLEAARDGVRGLLSAAAAGVGFRVQEVYAEGRRETSRADVLAALEIEQGQPTFGFDPQAAKRRLEALGWVHSATVQRQLPDAVYVRLVERRPIARWRQGDETMLVDREGRVIGAADQERFSHLPLLRGEGALKAAPALFDLLASEPHLFKRVEAAILIGERRWNLQFDAGLEVLLPEEGLDRAWIRLAELAREHGLFEKAVEAVDMRLSDRLVLRLTPAALGRLDGTGGAI